jgi:hypothetical protein
MKCPFCNKGFYEYIAGSEKTDFNINDINPDNIIYKKAKCIVCKGSGILDWVDSIIYGYMGE